MRKKSQIPMMVRPSAASIIYVLFTEAPWNSKPAIFYAQSLVTQNGFCGVMANPYNKTCQAAAYFSNTEKTIKGERVGAFYANNALWFKHNRFWLSEIGDESLKYKALFLYYPKIIRCLQLRSALSTQNVDCTDESPFWVGNSVSILTVVYMDSETLTQIGCKLAVTREDFSILNSVCEQCHDLYKEMGAYGACRSECFKSHYFTDCADVLMVPNKKELMEILNRIA